MKKITIEIEIPESQDELEAAAKKYRDEVEGAEGIEGDDTTSDIHLKFGVRAAFVLLQDADRYKSLEATHLACMIAAYIASYERRHE
jgi:hypothetical protein